MSQTLLERPTDRQSDGAPPPPPHAHWTLGSLAMLGIVIALVASLIGVAALAITANRSSVDDDLVADKVDSLLANFEPPSVQLDASASVIPVMIPMSELAAAPASEINAVYAPAVPPASGRTTQAIVEVNFEVVENVVTIDPGTGTEYETWGYRIVGNSELSIGTPGPIIRARVGDMLRFTLTNPASSTHPHNVDLHAVTGQGGGAADLVVAPGETKTIEARMLYPGFFMYHCAYGDVPVHIAHGMYGGILVDPETPLPAVDQEFYMVQSEYYTTSKDPGLVDTDRQAITDENPSYVVFNGAVGALAGDNALTMQVGERARIYFVNAGLNLISSFHPIGSHWDAVYPEAALLNAPLRGSQTTLIPAGGGTVVEIIGQVPSTIILVDHALSRTFDKGALGMLVIEGPENPEIFGVSGPPDTTEAPEPPPEAGPTVSILAGSGAAQAMDSPDEFDENESPGDYEVNVLTVKVGTTVTWTNDDDQLHTVTSTNGLFDSGFLDAGESYSYTFTQVGDFEYFCSPHPWMRARVIVEQ